MRGEPLRCPNDETRLVELERAGVLIDACPTCRGVWLDRGELDKILVKERELATGRDADEDFFREMGGGGGGGRVDRPREERYEAPREQPRKKRRKSLLEELLDFD